MSASLRCIVLVGCLLCPAAAAQEPDTTALGNAPPPADSLAPAPLHFMGFGDAASAGFRDRVGAFRFASGAPARHSSG